MSGSGVVPVVVVVDGVPVPAAIVGFERRMIPLHSGIGAGNDPAFASEAEQPHPLRFNLPHVPFNGVHLIGSIDGAGNGQVRAHVRIGVNLFDVGAGGEFIHQGAVAGDLDHIDYPERLIRDAAAIQQRYDRRLSPAGNFAQRVHHISALRNLGWQGRSGRQVRLLGENDQSFGRVPVGSFVEQAR